MVYATLNGDYKIPGSGLEQNEAHVTALTREVLEECGSLDPDYCRIWQGGGV